MSSRKKYQGTRVYKARAIAAAQLPCSCFRCGRMVTADMKWNADHPIERYTMEAQGVPEHEQDQMVMPVHRSCDARAGAKFGNKLKAKKKTQPRKIPAVKRLQLSFSDEAETVAGAPPQNPSPAEAEGAL